MYDVPCNSVFRRYCIIYSILMYHVCAASPNYSYIQHFSVAVVCRKDWGIIIRLELPTHPRPKKQKKTISDILPLRQVMPLFELSWVDLGIQSQSNSRDSRIPFPPNFKKQAKETEKLSGSRRRTGRTEKLRWSWFPLMCVLFFVSGRCTLD